MSNRPRLVSNPRGAIVVGASSGVGRAIAEHLAANGWSLVVAARSLDELERLAAHLRVRHGADVTALAIDLTDDDDHLAQFFERAVASVDTLDAVLIPAGVIAETDTATDDWVTTSRLVATNMIGVMKIAGRAITSMEAAGSGAVVVFSSIAAAVPRDRNVAYAAAKAGLESFARSMHHRLAGSDVSLQLYALGYVDTAMSRGQQLRLPPADPVDVARRVVEGLDRGNMFTYEPRYWRFAVMILRALPWFVYRRLKF